MIVSNPCTGDARVIKMAESAATNGHEVHVFATIGKNAIPYEVKNGVFYHRIEWNPGALIGEFILLKLVKFISRSLSAYLIKKLVPFLKYKYFQKIFIEHIVAVKPEIIHSHDLICLPVGIEAAKIIDAKVVYDAHELEVHRNPPLPFFQKRFVAYIEKKYGKKSNAVITVGTHIADILSDELSKKINVIYNSPIIESSSHTIRGDLNLDSKTPLIIYVGKVTLGRGVEDIISLLPNLPNIHFATIGPCDSKIQQKLRTQAIKLNVEKQFTILPPVSYKEVVNYIRSSNMGIIAIDTTPLSYRLSMPNKLFEMSFADVPILAKNELIETKEFIQEIGQGELIDFEQKEALVYQISKFLLENDKYKISDEKQKILEEKYSWNVQAMKLNTIYDSLLLKKKNINLDR